MTDPTPRPEFSTFTRWLAASMQAAAATSADSVAYGRALAAARTARDHYLTTLPRRAPRFETLQLHAAASEEEGAQPPQLTTARGFRVTLSYDEGDTPGESSIAVLVQCPPDMIQAVQGETAYLWNGAERFALGQFDTDGKALGTLPAGVEISLTDFTQGNVKLEEPDLPPG